MSRNNLRVLRRKGRRLKIEIQPKECYSALLTVSGLPEDVHAKGRVVLYNKDLESVTYSKAAMWREGNVYYIGLTEDDLSYLHRQGYYSLRFHVNIKCDLRPKDNPFDLYFKLVMDGESVENDFDNIWGPCLAKPEGLERGEDPNGPEWTLRRGCSLHKMEGWSYIDGPYTKWRRFLRWLCG